jgi:protein-S-isoprenylcysteine O-methyltransferase Ste14
VPLPLRVVAYAAVFLGVVCGLLPWLAHRVVEARWPDALDVGPLRTAGWAVLGLSLSCYLAATAWLTTRGRGAYVEFDPPSRLVASGPYRWQRNPVATCALGVLLGLGLAFSSAGVLLLFVVAVAVAHLQVVAVEEPRLRRRFGADYEAYAASVPRWIPRRPRRPR